MICSLALYRQVYLVQFKFVFCVFSVTNLIFLRFPVKLVHQYCCICALFGQSVRGVLFYMFSFAFFCNLVREILLFAVLCCFLSFFLSFFIFSLHHSERISSLFFVFSLLSIQDFYRFKSTGAQLTLTPTLNSSPAFFSQKIGGCSSRSIPLHARTFSTQSSKHVLI